MAQRKKTDSSPCSVPGQAGPNEPYYRPDFSPKQDKQLSLMELQGCGRDAILDDIQASWSLLPAPPSTEEISLWINAGRRGA